MAAMSKHATHQTIKGSCGSSPTEHAPCLSSWSDPWLCLLKTEVTQGYELVNVCSPSSTWKAGSPDASRTKLGGRMRPNDLDI